MKSETKLPTIKLSTDGRRIMWGTILIAETAHADWQAEDAILSEAEGLAIAAEMVKRWNEYNVLRVVAEEAVDIFERQSPKAKQDNSYVVALGIGISALEAIRKESGK